LAAHAAQDDTPDHDRAEDAEGAVNAAERHDREDADAAEAPAGTGSGTGIRPMPGMRTPGKPNWAAAGIGLAATMSEVASSSLMEVPRIWMSLRA
jgi:hypothetical protein